jgi:UDP-N-acetylmuramoyl-tripeptide--D-alanyl-D-alanine ligase
VTSGNREEVLGLEIIKLEEILRAVNGEIYAAGREQEYKEVSTDTRKLGRGSIFIALKGDNFNGNDFIVEASEKGAALCIADEINFDRRNLDKAMTVIKVEDSKRALLELAKYYRSKLDIKIVGITGSTGKTSTKDLVAAALGGKYRVFKTKGNLNNEIGLPLMIFKLDRSYDVAVLEMGMNNLNEIHRLSDVAQPDIAIITNIGISHIENLKTRENILKAKMEITDFFTSENTLIINGDNDLLSSIHSQCYKVVKIGMEKEFDHKAENIILNEGGIEFQIKEGGRLNPYLFSIPVPGKHNISNSLLAIACGRQLGMRYEEIAKGLESLEVTSMRLDIVKTKKFTIIDDSYNASPDSMKAAMEVQAQIKGSRKLAVLGTMKELGDKSYEAHKEIGSYAGALGIDVLITVGEYNSAYCEGYGCRGNCKGFSSIDEAGDYITSIVRKDDVILVKASRSMKFETIVDRLKKIND